MLCLSKNFTLIFSFLFGVMVPASAPAQSIDNLLIVKISSADSTAVVQENTGKISLIKVGDIMMDQFRIIEITENRIIFENGKSEVGEQIVVHIKDGEQVIERITRMPGKESQLYQQMKMINTLKK